MTGRWEVMSSERRPAWIAIGIGLGLGVVYTVALTASQGPGGLLFGFAYLAPFIVSTIALELDGSGLRPFWFGCALSAFLLGFTSVVGVTSPLFLSAIAFVVAGVKTPGWRGPWTALALGLGPVIASGLNVAALFGGSPGQFYGVLAASVATWGAMSAFLVISARRSARVPA